MKNLWSKMERYEKKIAVVVIVVAVAVLVSTRFDRVDEGGMVNTGEDSVVNIQKIQHPVMVEWDIFVVKNGDCYSVGDSTGWVYGGCKTLEYTTRQVIDLKAADRRKIEQKSRPWVRVE